MEIPFDFNKRRALVLDGGDDNRITLTTVQDLANVVARAIDFEGEWPVVSGIRGADISIGQLIALGEKIRGSCASLIDLGYVLTLNEPGAPFEIEKLKADELESGAWQTSWIPKLDHPSISPEQVAMFSRTSGIGCCQTTSLLSPKSFCPRLGVVSHRQETTQ
jgi:hypothetical protein